jgi:hypothetical protein
MRVIICGLQSVMRVIKWRSMRGMWNVWEMSENVKGKDHLGDLVDES